MIGVLCAALHDEHPLVRIAAVRALGTLGRGSRASLDEVLRLLHDSDWEVREAVVEALGTIQGHADGPALAVLRAVHPAQLDAPVADAGAEAGSEPLSWSVGTLGRAANHFWQVLARQPAILQRSWLRSLLVLLLGDALVLLAVHQSFSSMHDLAITLGLVTTLSAVIGIISTSNLALDVGAELAQATATSARTLLLCRFLLVLSSTALVSGVASAAFALFSGQGPWAIIQLWLGPLLLLSALTFLLVLWVGSGISFLVALALEAAQTLRFAANGQVHIMPHSPLWQTNPLILSLAALCLLVTFLYAPRYALPFRQRDAGW